MKIPIIALLALICMTLIVALTGCGTAGYKLPEGLILSGAYVDANTGAKAVISTNAGRLGGKIRVPITDAAGAQTGWADIEATK